MKQQRIMQREYNSQDCIISFLYIKPQLPPYWLFRDAVVLYRFSTSNHNLGYTYSTRHAVVLYRFSTSNNNGSLGQEKKAKLYYIVSLHQTTTIHTERGAKTKLYYIVSLHQTTTQATRCVHPACCIISFLYIKPQRRVTSAC